LTESSFSLIINGFFSQDRARAKAPSLSENTAELELSFDLVNSLGTTTDILHPIWVKSTNDKGELVGAVVGEGGILIR